MTEAEKFKQAEIEKLAKGQTQSQSPQNQGGEKEGTQKESAQGKKKAKGVEIKKALISMVMPGGRAMVAGEPITLTQEEYDAILKAHPGEDNESKLWEK